MDSSFEYIPTLEYRLKAAGAQIHAFKSGEPEKTALFGAFVVSVPHPQNYLQGRQS